MQRLLFLTVMSVVTPCAAAAVPSAPCTAFVHITVVNPSKTLAGERTGIQGEMGTIAPGKLADLVLLDANPTEDIRNLRKISGVVANGKFYDRADLDHFGPSQGFAGHN